LDEEFVLSRTNRLQAIDSQVVDRIDLLSVVEHELGHVLGLADLDSSINDLMSGRLQIGVRLTPSLTDRAALLTSY
jgi:hypothetical protein